MNLGLEALNPLKFSAGQELALYSEINFHHLQESLDRLGLETEKIKRKSKTIKEQLNKKEPIGDDEKDLCALLIQGDKYWLYGSSRWLPHRQRSLFYIPERLFRIRTNFTVKRYGLEIQNYPRPDYSSPRSFNSFRNQELIRNVNGSIILHIDWLEYLLKNLNIRNNLDFDRARYESLEYVINDVEMSEETRKLQIALTESDIIWIKELDAKFDFNPFFLQNSREYLEEFKKQISRA